MPQLISWQTNGIDTEALNRDRDQLWAEAAIIEAEGGNLVLPRELWEMAGEIQDERRQHDPWDDILIGVEGALYTAADGLTEEIGRAHV